MRKRSKATAAAAAATLLGITGAVISLGGPGSGAGRARAAFEPAPQQKIRVAGKEFENEAAFIEGGRRCATPPPSDEQLLRTRAAAAAVRQLAGVEEALSAGTEVTVKVCFHVIHKGDEGKLKTEQLDQQIKVLNKAYQDSGFHFKTESVDFKDVAGTPNEAWYTMGHRSRAEREAKTALGRDPEQFLNFYTADLSNSLLGWATFPDELEGDPARDGVVILNTSLPAADGSANPEGGPFGLGQTATHEVGHWLGLYHTFQGACSPPGDEVADTPPHNTNFGCPPASTDTCPGDKDPLDPTKPWTDPVKNYMNYSDDACMSELTKGQINRAREQTTTFRPLLYSIPAAVRLDIQNAVAPE